MLFKFSLLTVINILRVKSSPYFCSIRTESPECIYIHRENILFEFTFYYYLQFIAHLKFIASLRKSFFSEGVVAFKVGIKQLRATINPWGKVIVLGCVYVPYSVFGNIRIRRPGRGSGGSRRSLTFNFKMCNSQPSKLEI